MQTVAEILDKSIKFLNRGEIKKPRLLVEELLSHVLGVKRLDLYLQFDRPLLEEELDTMRKHLKQAAAKMPWQYIVGEVMFLGRKIKVDPRVLIPRQETEILADRIVKELPERACVIWDVCCGSGCLGIAIKGKRADCEVILSDVSADAVAAARENGKELGLEVRQGDLLEPFRGGSVDVIVCNPPYIAEKDYEGLEEEVRSEPKLALVAGKSGYEFYERLAGDFDAIIEMLRDGGKMYLEIGSGMGEKVAGMFRRDGVEVVVGQDWAGHDRFVIVKKL